jgi:hypothetical protein
MMPMWQMALLWLGAIQVCVILFLSICKIEPKSKSHPQVIEIMAPEMLEFYNNRPLADGSVALTANHCYLLTSRRPHRQAPHVPARDGRYWLRVGGGGVLGPDDDEDDDEGDFSPLLW